MVTTGPAVCALPMNNHGKKRMVSSKGLRPRRHTETCLYLLISLVPTGNERRSSQLISFDSNQRVGSANRKFHLRVLVKDPSTAANYFPPGRPRPRPTLGVVC